VSYLHITSDQQLQEYCSRVAQAPEICFDTEFISENSYRSELCLIQVAVGDELAVIDPLAVKSVQPFWDLVVAPGHDTLVHAGREELNFCLNATGKCPNNLFDVQIAAGLISNEYPAGYGSLLYKMLGITLEKGETRTDWSRRPLSKQQLEYALDDVRHLPKLAQQLRMRLHQLGRTEWHAEEMTVWQNEVTEYRQREQWYKLSGINSLSRRSLAVLREVWLWREQEAQRRNQPVRRVLRDDLLIELAKRRSADPKQIQALRGMERSDFGRIVPAIAHAIQKGLSAPELDLPASQRPATSQQYSLLGQLLSTALTSLCRSQNIAVSLVGTASDVRDLISYRLGVSKEKPSLATGWREQIVGHLFEDILHGRTTIRIGDPHSDDPLVFEARPN
jgi:ribonuclease D